MRLRRAHLASSMLAFGLLVVGCGSPEDDSAESPDLIPMEEAQESVTDPAQVRADGQDATDCLLYTSPSPRDS